MSKITEELAIKPSNDCYFFFIFCLTHGADLQFTTLASVKF